MAGIAAQQYYVDYGADMHYERLINLIPTYIPDSSMTGSKTLERWAQMVLNELKNVSKKSKFWHTVNNQSAYLKGQYHHDQQGMESEC